MNVLLSLCDNDATATAAASVDDANDVADEVEDDEAGRC